MNDTEVMDATVYSALVILLEALIVTGLPTMGGNLKYHDKMYRFELREVKE